MDLNEYQMAAKRTIPGHWQPETIIAHAAHKIPGEAGEVADMFGKVYQGHNLDQDKLVEELGDLLWHIAEMATGLGVTLEDVAQANIVKLKARYPTGFSAERSRNRREYSNGGGIADTPRRER